MNDTPAGPSDAQADQPDQGALHGSISLERRGHLLLIGLNRPAKYNGLTPAMMRELSNAFSELHYHDDLRVGVVFGHGDHFTAGLDLPMFREAMLKGNDGGERAETKAEQPPIDPFALGRYCRKPVVVAVHGITYTAGIEMMLGCDIVVAADNCRFSQLEPKRGIMATGGATVRFVERGGYGNAMYHLLLLDEFDAAEALRVGLVQEVVPLGTQLDRAIELADKIANLAPLAVYATKESARRYLEEGQRAAFDQLTPTQAVLAATADAEEGVASFRERREPKFTGT